MHELSASNQMVCLWLSGLVKQLTTKSMPYARRLRRTVLESWEQSQIRQLSATEDMITTTQQPIKLSPDRGARRILGRFIGGRFTGGRFTGGGFTWALAGNVTYS